MKRQGLEARTATAAALPAANPQTPMASDQAAESAALLQASLQALAALEAATAASLLASERARSVSAALDRQLTALAEAKGNGAPGPVPAEPLSPREREVLALVAEGHSNKVIAERLFLSPNTIKSHVSSLLAKLRAETRVQLAVIAARPSGGLAG